LPVTKSLIQILDRGLSLAAVAVTAALLAACGQKGPLYLPTGEAAASRATLPQSLNPTPPASAVTNTGTGQANPAPRP
jgi:predicted small lipoprotein YifL